MAPPKTGRLTFDPTIPNAGRMADYFLGGKDNFAADRAAAQIALALAPELPAMSREGRRFLGPRRDNLRTLADVRRFFDGLTLVEPGLVCVPRWRPDGIVLHRPDSVWVVGGVGRRE